MMQIDLEKKSKELKEFVSQFETTMFLGDISSYMSFLRPDISLGLSSPQRQLYYLAGLNISSKIPQKENVTIQFSDEDFNVMVKLLNKIEKGYEQLFYPKKDETIDEEWISRRQVSMSTFFSYFNQGNLNYEEQEIERVFEYFQPFNDEIKKEFGISVRNFIDIYNFIDTLPNIYLDENLNPKEDKQTWEEFIDKMDAENVMPWEMQEHMPKHITERFEFMHDKGKMFRYSKQIIVNKFGSEKTNCFLNTLTVKREQTDFIFYTEPNVLYSKPIFDIENDLFQIIEPKQIIHGIYNNLFEFCKRNNNIREKFYRNRGKKLENKIEQIFTDFFDKNTFIHKSYFTQKKHEQDILVLNKGLALIIEAKSSKRDEPRRDPNLAYPLIISNFKETIQNGYDQTDRVKEIFDENEILKIYSDQKLTNNIVNIKTKNYHKVFSIIVTLERFGNIQTNLSNLLEKWEDDDYPWSVCIDDLEVFLLQLKKSGMKKPKFVNFLSIREKIHHRIKTGDELEICGGFIENVINQKILKTNTIIPSNPEITEIFDKTYNTKGLGFVNEKNLEIKTNDKYLKMY